MNRLIAVALLALSAPALASEGALPFNFKPNTGNPVVLQRGAADFMNYCSGCHGLKYLRYNRMGRDLGIPDELLKANLMFTGDKLGDHILSSMPGASKDPTVPTDSEKWFGKAPPDLSLTARERGPDWVYSYLLSFYLDPARPAGVNNVVLPNASMPHVLGDLQGWQTAHFVNKPETDFWGNPELNEKGEPIIVKHFEKLELVQQGRLTPAEYKEFVSDLTNFLVYAGEPGRNHRIVIGVGALLFMLVFGICAYLLKLEYWKDVH